MATICEETFPGAVTAVYPEQCMVWTSMYCRNHTDDPDLEWKNHCIYFDQQIQRGHRRSTGRPSKFYRCIIHTKNSDFVYSVFGENLASVKDLVKKALS